MIKDLFKHSGIYFFGTILGKIVTTLAWIVVAKSLTPDKYGQITLYLLILNFTTLIGDFGLKQWYLKYKDHTDVEATFSKTIFVRLITLIISIIFLGFFLFSFHTFDYIITIYLLISLIPDSISSIAESYYLGLKKSFTASLRLISLGSFFLIGYFIFLQNLDIHTTAFILLISLTLTSIWFIPWKELKGVKILPLAEVKSVLFSSASYFYLNLTSYFYNRGDSFLISYFKGNFALGIYALAYRYLESLALMTSSLTQNLFPLSAKKDGVTKNQTVKITFLMFLIGSFLACAVFLLADLLVIRLFGVQYAGATLILKIFSLVLILFFINAPLATIVQSSHLVNKFLPYGIGNTLLNLILNILFIPKFGIIAAAWIMVITEFSGLIINFIFVKKLYR